MQQCSLQALRLTSSSYARVHAADAVLRLQLFQCLTGSELILASRIDAECAGPDFPYFGEPRDSLLPSDP